MVDVTTQQPLRVSTDGTVGPYILVPLSQLGDVQRLLDSRGVPYWVDEEAVSLNGSPAVTVIDLGRKGDANAVQSLLDTVR